MTSSCGLRLVAVAASHRADAGGQLARGERFGHVVVRAELQTDELVHRAVAGGQHADRHGRALAQPVAGQPLAGGTLDRRVVDPRISTMRIGSRSTGELTASTVAPSNRPRWDGRRSARQRVALRVARVQIR